eukprot:gene8477-35206_t
MSSSALGADASAALVAQLEADLIDSDDFWTKSGIDHENGGFMCALAHDGTLLSGDKFIWYQGRGLWVYSRLYRMHGGREEHGAIATKTFRFIMDHFIDQDGHFVVATDREGNVIQPANPKSCNTTGYGTAFLAEGFFEYYRATRDPKALPAALNALKVFQALIDDETMTPDEFLEDASLVTGDDRAWLEELNQRTVDLIIHKFHHPEFGVLSESLDKDYNRKDDANEDFAYLGHGIEVMWMVMAEALRRAAVELATDNVYGGAFRGMTSVRNQTFMWVQDEIMVGCCLMAEHGAPESDVDKGWAARTLLTFNKHVTKTTMYIQDKFYLKDRGLPYVLVGGDRQVRFRESYVNKGQPGALNRKENYHHPRAIMLLLESFRRQGIKGGNSAPAAPAAAAAAAAATGGGGGSASSSRPATAQPAWWG